MYFQNAPAPGGQSMAMGIAFADDMPSPKNSLQCDQQLDLMLPEFFFLQSVNLVKVTGDRNKSSGALNSRILALSTIKWQNNSTCKRYFPLKKRTNVLSKGTISKRTNFIFQASTGSGDIR